MGDLSSLSIEDGSSYQRIPFGKEMAKHFLFDSKFKNMNHGSFGGFPVPVRKKAQEFRDQVEARPDPFIRYLYPNILDESREAIAKLVCVPVPTIVFVPNATTGVATVLRNIVWNTNGKDEILYFNTIYGACGKIVDYTCEASRDLLQSSRIDLVYPIEDDALVAKFKKAIEDSRKAGRRPRIAIFDTVSSMPGLRMPFEDLIKVCREEKILSLVDGAHGVGHLPLNLSALDPDFFVSNCHKWLHVPRGCAIFYVPERNQPLIRSTLPTSHGFVSRNPNSPFTNPLPASNKSDFVTNFEFVGTMDNTPYLCVPEALKWREEAAGGEHAIHEYCQKIVNEGGEKIANILGTNILDNKAGTLTKCCMVNVRLPLVIAHDSHIQDNADQVPKVYTIKPGYGAEATEWMLDTLMSEYDTFLAIFFFQGNWWVRMCGQVYLDLSDFEWAGRVLKELCERVGQGEYLGAMKKFGAKKVLKGGDLARDGINAVA